MFNKFQDQSFQFRLETWWHDIDYLGDSWARKELLHIMLMRGDNAHLQEVSVYYLSLQ